MGIARQIVAHGEVEMLRDPWLATRTPALIGTTWLNWGLAQPRTLHAYE